MVAFSDLKSSKNVAALLDDDELSRIASKVIAGHEIDEASRSEWFETTRAAMDLAKQVVTAKNTPWTGASNIKYPLITRAAIDFASRTLPVIIQNDRVVQLSVIGRDSMGEKLNRARRVGKYMSYQLLFSDDDWEDQTDKLLHILPVVGTVFKKTYYHPLKKHPVSEVCEPEDIVVNSNIKSLEDARRIGHKLFPYRNDIIERIRAEVYSDIDVELLCSSEGYETDDEDGPIELLEQHCFLDLDDDGYQEPYVVVVHINSGQVLRIVNRFGAVSKNKKGEILKIDPQHYFTDFHYIKSPDGGFYSIGLGSLLLPINETINTLSNQLVDAGTLNNMQGGFIGRGLRLKNGEFKLKLGEWKVLDAATGTNLQQNIVPLPTKEPSATLFQLLNLFIEAGKDLSSANDILQGKGPTQNVPATTVMTMVEQGMKIFNAVHKRLHRSLKKEFYKLFKLHQKYLTDDEYESVLDEPASVKADFREKGVDVIPVADPVLSSDAQRLAKAQVVMGVPGIDPRAAALYYLEAIQLDQATIDKLLPPVDPNAPPAPEVAKLMAETSYYDAQAKAKILEAQVISEDQMLKSAKMNIDRDEAMVRAEEAGARIVKMREDSAVNQAKVQIMAGKADHEAKLAELSKLHEREKDQVSLSLDTLKLGIEDKKIDQKAEADRLKAEVAKVKKKDDNKG